MSARGTLFVGNRSGSAVYAVSPGGKTAVVADGLSMPNGVAFREGTLYIAEVGRILKIENVEANPNAKPEIVYDRLPGDTHHGLRFIRFGPDGKLYIPIGMPCNVCEREGYGLIGFLDLNDKNIRSAQQRGEKLRRLRLATGHARAVVYRQRARHARRRPAG